MPVGLALGWEPTPNLSFPFGLAGKVAMPTTPAATAGTPLLPVPEISVRRSDGPNEGPVTFTAGHYFSPVGDIDLYTAARSRRPMPDCLCGTDNAMAARAVGAVPAMAVVSGAGQRV